MSINKAVELRAQRAKAHKQAQELVARAEAENRNLSAEEQVSFDKIHADMEELRARYERIEATEATARELSESRGRITETTSVSSDEQMENEARYSAAFKNFLVRGRNGMSAADRAVFEQRAQSVGVDADGGYTVPEEMSRSIEASLKAFGGMRSVAEVISTASGNDLRLLTSDDTSNVGELLAENVATAAQDIAFGQVILQAFKYSSKAVLVSNELLQDSGVNIVDFIGSRIGERIARITNTHFTTGTGSSQPNGIVTATNTGVTAASATAVTTDEIIDLVHSVDPAYRANGKFMMNDAIVKAVRKLKDSTNQYLWQPGLSAGAPDRLFGFDVVVNQAMSSAMTTGQKIMIFGDLSKYKIRDAGSLRVRRLDERYAELDQVAFFGMQRTDGDLLDAGTDPVKKLVLA